MLGFKMLMIPSPLAADSSEAAALYVWMTKGKRGFAGRMKSVVPGGPPPASAVLDKRSASSC